MVEKMIPNQFDYICFLITFAIGYLIGKTDVMCEDIEDLKNGK